MKDNIILIGMPGVGKSTVGVILAKILGYRFLDSDLLIQESQGMLLKDIIEQKGVDGFVHIENQINKSINVNRTIIATGGSAVYGAEAMEHFSNIGHIVYLKLDLEHLEKRLGDIKNRGVVLRKGQDLKGLFEERTALYEQYADIQIDESGMDIEQTVETLIRKLS